MARFLLLAVVLALPGVGFMIAADPPDVPAQLTVTVPEDAQLFFNGSLTRQTGTSRTFSTPPLQAGYTYTYEIKAQFSVDGQPQSVSKIVTVRPGDNTKIDMTSPDPGDSDPPVADNGWPRKFTQEDIAFTIYQPQLESWDKNQLQCQSAIAAETKASSQPVYGVVWFSAQTEVDKEARQVTLSHFQINRVSFPTKSENEARYLELLKTQIPTKSKTIALDRLQAGLAVSKAISGKGPQKIKNDVPRILFSRDPGLLILIDGQPVLRPIDGGDLLRVINTRALILFDQNKGVYYLYMMDRWLTASKLEGPWSAAAAVPDAAEKVRKGLGDKAEVDLLNSPAPDIKEELEKGILPKVFVSYEPAELLETTGEPQMSAIEGTKFLYVKNSPDEILLDTNSNQYYVLLSGRWFQGPSLEKGPWKHVARDQLTADIAKIPPEHPKGDVLAAVPGTPQAQSALIANSIPQTATIKRSDAKLAVTYDGDPKFEAIGTTNLQYAVNTPTPVVQTNDRNYYAVENGVWFNGTSPTGPWAAATSVPAEIYTIPPECPINYVSNVYVYGYTPDYVYTGYTPGYLGTYIDPLGCVVYGTGWYYRPWIGNWWFGRPWSYGWGATFRWTPYGGWGFGFAYGWGRPWWGPIGWHSGWGAGGWWRPGWENGWGGGYRNIHNTQVNFNNFNAYNRWGNNIHVNNQRNTRIGNQTNINTGNIQRGNLNNVYASHSGNVFRPTGNNKWETNTNKGWQNFHPQNTNLSPQIRNDFNNINNRLNAERTSRQIGQSNLNTYHPATSYHNEFRAGGSPGAGGFAGYHPSGGYRTGGFSGGFRGGRR